MHRRAGWAGLLVSASALAWFGCGEGPAVTEQPGGSKLGSGGASSAKLGVGATCAQTSDCRAGLSCDPKSSTCAPGHSLKAGDACALNDECAMGLACVGGVCATAGAGQPGVSCGSDADCASGNRCLAVGLGAECGPEGKGDVGATCATSGDCFGGLACSFGKCAAAPVGAPPFASGFLGEKCNMEDPSPQAYFHVPRGSMDGDFYRLPFPNDVRLDAGKVDLTGHPVPGSDVLGYDLVDRYLRAIEKDSDGFGVYGTVTFRFSVLLESSTFEINKVSSVALVNLTTASDPMSLYYGYSTNGGHYVCGNVVTVRQPAGILYDEGSTYAAYITTALKGKGGVPLKPVADLVALLADTAPAASDVALAKAWPKYKVFRDYLTAKAIDPTTILTAAVFTVGKPSAPIEKLAAAVTAAAPPPVSGWVKCDAGVKSPCPDVTGDRACAAADPDFDELHALVKLPVYQTGTAPYLTPTDGGAFTLDGMGTPMVARTEDVCLSLTVPKGAVPAAGWPTLVFAHGVGGDFRTHVVKGIAKDFAKGVADGNGATVQAAVLGIDQVQHGPRRGASQLSSVDLFWNWGNPKAMRGNAQQQAADQLALARLVPTVTFDVASSPTGTAFALAPTTAFWGHSEGATAGAIMLPWSTFRGAALSGEGGSFIDSLLEKTSPTNAASAVPFILGDATSKGALNGGVTNPVLSLIQTYLDGADALAFAGRDAASPMMNPHHVFQVYGQADTFTPKDTELAYAIAAGLGLVAHDASVSTPDDVVMLPEIPTPATGNLTLDGKPITAVLRQYAPAAGSEGHGVAFDLASAHDDVERYAAGVLSGAAPQVGK